MQSALAFRSLGIHLTSNEIQCCEQIWKTTRAKSWRSHFLLPSRRMVSTFWLWEYQKTFELDKGPRRLVMQDKPLWALSKSIYEHFPTNTLSDQFWWKISSGSDSLRRRSLNRKHRRSRSLLSLEANWNPSINFAVENTNIVWPKFNFIPREIIQKINGRENLATPGNSWVDNWEKKSDHDTRNGPHATREGNNLTGCTVGTRRTWTVVED